MPDEQKPKETPPRAGGFPPVAPHPPSPEKDLPPRPVPGPKAAPGDKPGEKPEAEIDEQPEAEPDQKPGDEPQGREVTILSTGGAGTGEGPLTIHGTVDGQPVSLRFAREAFAHLPSRAAKQQYVAQQMAALVDAQAERPPQAPSAVDGIAGGDLDIRGVVHLKDR